MRTHTCTPHGGFRAGLFGIVRLVIVALMAAFVIGCGEDNSGPVEESGQTLEATPASSPASVTSLTSPSATSSSEGASLVSDNATLEPDVSATVASSPTLSPTTPSSPTSSIPDTAEIGTAEIGDLPSTYHVANRWDAKTLQLGRMTVGPDGRIYVADTGRQIVLIFNSDGSDAGSTDYPDGPTPAASSGIAVSPAGVVYVISADSSAILAYAPDGTFIEEWYDGIGTGPGEIAFPTAIAVDREGLAYVTDETGRLQVFTPEGEPLAEWTRAGDYLFPYPRDIAIADGMVHVLGDGYRGGETAILTFDTEGNLVREPLLFGGDAGIDLRAWSFDVLPDGQFVVSDAFAGQVAILSSEGEIVDRWQVTEPESLALIEVASGADGTIYVANGAGLYITAFAPGTGSERAEEPTLRLGPNWGSCDVPVVAIGKGLPPETTLALVATPPNGDATVVTKVATDANGIFSVEMIPGAPLGPCTGGSFDAPMEIEVGIVADESGDPLVTMPFHLYPDTALPALTVSPDSGGCEDTILVSGQHFTPGSAVALFSELGSYRPLAEVVVGDDGVFTVELTGEEIMGACPGPNETRPLSWTLHALTQPDEKPDEKPEPEVAYPSASAAFELRPGE